MKKAIRIIGDLVNILKYSLILAIFLPPHHQKHYDAKRDKHKGNK